MIKVTPCRKFFLLVLLLPDLSNAQTWQAVNPPLNIFNGNIYSTTVSASGAIYAAGDFKNNADACFVAKWDGTDWVELGSDASSLNANGAIYSITHRGDTVYAAGSFANSSDNPYVAKW